MYFFKSTTEVNKKFTNFVGFFYFIFNFEKVFISLVGQNYNISSFKIYKILYLITSKNICFLLIFGDAVL